MKCPRCGKQMETHNQTQMNIFSMKRFKKCHSCKLKLITIEKVVFNSLPTDMKNNYLANGEKPRWNNDLK